MEKTIAFVLTTVLMSTAMLAQTLSPAFRDAALDASDALSLLP